jgi:hypothetical protein|nr:MAG TPA: adhesin [Caudoviricetes sp.]
MKKILLAMLIVAIAGCSKDEEPASGFSQVENEALQVLNGTFACDDTTIVFAPFDSPSPKKSTLNEVTIDFFGTMSYSGKYNSEEYYFYVNPSDGEICAYAMHSEKVDYFNALVGKTWNYEIIDSNTITLFDTDLSNPLVQTKTYKRK